MTLDQRIPDPVTGGVLSCQDDAWVVIHPDGRVEWLGDAQDRAEHRARLIAEIDQARCRLDQLVTEHPELKSK